MLSLNQSEKVTCDICGTQTAKLNLAHHKKICSIGTLYCTQCSIFPYKPRAEMKYHIAKKHSCATARVVHEHIGKRLAQLLLIART